MSGFRNHPFFFFFGKWIRLNPQESLWFYRAVAALEAAASGPPPPQRGVGSASDPIRKKTIDVYADRPLRVRVWSNAGFVSHSCQVVAFGTYCSSPSYTFSTRALFRCFGFIDCADDDGARGATEKCAVGHGVGRSFSRTCEKGPFLQHTAMESVPASRSYLSTTPICDALSVAT
jgi:hypothetical protein